MPKTYFMIGCDEEGLYIKELSEDHLLQSLDKGAYGNVEFLRELPGQAGFYVNQNHWPIISISDINFILIIEGHPVVPKAKEVVTKYSLEE